jgi:hypothetical protein
MVVIVAVGEAKNHWLSPIRGETTNRQEKNSIRRAMLDGKSGVSAS